MELIIFLVIGALAGWIAGTLMKGSGFGLVGDLVVGVAGAYIGKYLFNVVFGFVGIPVGGFFATLAAAVLGAAILIFLVGLVTG